MNYWFSLRKLFTHMDRLIHSKFVADSVKMSAFDGLNRFFFIILDDISRCR